MNKRIADLLPYHYRDQYPRFITFLEKYYEWMFRKSGLSDSEIGNLRSDTSWLSNDIDKFIAAGDIRYVDQSIQGVIDQSIVNLANTISPGEQSMMLSADFFMDRPFEPYQTSDGSGIVDANDASVELSSVENAILDGWFTSMGFDRIKRNKINSINNIDQVLLLSLLKHIYSIKGTEKSIQIFFSLYFNETVTIHQPKSDIAVIDESWVLDGYSVIRDDQKYQEYSYVIKVVNEPETYVDVIDSVFIRNVHPAGFRFELEKV